MATEPVTPFHAALVERYDALETGDIPPLESFVDGVIASLDEPSNHCANETHVYGCPCRMGGDAAIAADAGRLRVRDDYWPASGTFYDGAWDEAKAEYDRLQLADLTDPRR